jgi:hypothetical protein
MSSSDILLRDKISSQLEIDGFSPEEIINGLALIDPPADFKGLHEYLETVDRISSIINTIIREYTRFKKELTTFSDGIQFCQKLRASSLLLASLIPAYSIKTSSNKQPLRGNHVDHALYVSLAYGSLSTHYQTCIDLLLAHLCVIAVVLKSDAAKEGEPKLFKSALTTALSSIHVVMSKPDELTAYPDTLIDLKDYFDKISRIDTTHAKRISHAMACSIGLKEGRIRHVDNRVFIKNALSTSTYQRDCDPEQETSPFPATTTVHTVANSLSTHTKSLGGCNKREFNSGKDLITTDFGNKNPTGNRTARQHVVRTRQVKTHIAMLNQRLAHRIDSLTLYEVDIFLNAVELLHTSPSSTKKINDIGDVELAAVLSTMFWISRPVEELLKIKLYRRARKKYDHTIGYIKGDISGNGCWIICPEKTATTPLPAESRQLTVQPNAVFILQSGIHVEQIIDSYLTDFKRFPSLNNRYLFRIIKNRNKQKQEDSKKRKKPAARDDVEHYLKPISKFLSKLNAKHGTRLTCKRISDYLYTELARQEGSDIATAMLITGRIDSLGHNQLHYTNLSVDRLNTIYQLTCRDVVPDAIYNNYAQQQRFPERGDMLGCHVGSTYRPTKETVKKLTDFLKSEITHWQKALPSVKRIIEFHNALTSYTVLMLSFATGFRAVRNPFTAFSQFDLEEGVAVLSDKDNVDYYNSRLVWLPEVCIDQVIYYQDHLADLAVRINYIDPKLSGELMKHGWMGSAAIAPPFFYLNRSGKKNSTKLNIVQPKRLKEAIKDIYPLPINANRHYLRSILLEKNCPPNVLAAFAGHWERGEEPWGKFSSLDPHYYKTTVSNLLTEVLKDDGWKACPWWRTDG